MQKTTTELPLCPRLSQQDDTPSQLSPKEQGGGELKRRGDSKVICPLFGHPSPPVINCKCTNRKQLLGSQIKRTQENYTSFRPAALSSTPLLHTRVKRLCPTRWKWGGRRRTHEWNGFEQVILTMLQIVFGRGDKLHRSTKRGLWKYATQTPNPELSAWRSRGFQNSKTLIDSEQHCLTNTSPPCLSRTGWQETPTSWNWLHRVRECVVCYEPLLRNAQRSP